VTILATADGEESFVDTNNNNRYDAGEPFEDLGNPYLDKDEDRVYSSAYTNLQTGTAEADAKYPLPTGAAGTTACPANSNAGLSVANTCNGIWDRYTKVRRSALVVFSGGEICPPSGYDATIPSAHRTAALFGGGNTWFYPQIADCNGNPLPAGTTFAVVGAPSTCVATLDGGSPLVSTTEPQRIAVTLKGCAEGDSIRVSATVTSSGGTLTSTVGFTVPAP
jgi:hypothetical protein